MFKPLNITNTSVNWKGILIFFFSIATCRALPQDFNFRNFNTEEGLAQSYIYSIIQDAKGYLWIGTGDGLSNYNGLVIKNFTTSDSLADNFITCGINDGESLWVGHMNGRLSYYNGKQFQGASLLQSDVSAITHFAKSPDGQIWVSTYVDGLFKLGKESQVVKHYIFKDQWVIITFDFLNDHELLIGTTSGLLHCRLTDSGEIEIIRPVAEIPESKVMCIQKMRNRPGFYIATENEGIFQIAHEGNLIKASQIITDIDFEGAGIQDICEDGQSNLWLGSFGKGLIKMIYSDSGKFSGFDYFNRSNGFATDNVKIVYEDREGSIWCGNYGEGLTQITPRAFSVRAFEKPVYGNDILSICIDQQGKWIGTERGLLKMDLQTDKILKFYGNGKGLPKDSATAIYSADGKVLWIGTDKNGLFRMEAGKDKILRYPIGNGALENSINIIRGKGEQVWIGTKKGLCSINSRTNEVKWYSISQGGLPHNFINCLYEDRTGKLWVSTRSNILAYIQDEKVFKIPLNSGSGILSLGPITEDAESRIWVGSNGNGVFRIMADSVANITVKEGLLSDYCYSLISDNHHNIWVGHKGGLSRIRTTDYSVKPIQQIEGTTDNLNFNTNAIFKDQQEKLWFGSDKGLVSYDPSMESSQFLPPVLSITSIKINDEERDYADKIILSPGNYKIKIDFLGISLKEPKLVTYQYKLDGYDQWSEITKDKSITYNHLIEGSYTFILKASSGDGAVSENPLILNIIIKKPIWKKWWFYFTGVLLLIALTFVYIKRREYSLITEKRILEEKVLERTHEIESQKNEIELQRDMINKKNDNITASITYASHIQNAILPPLEVIDKLFPNNFILSKPKDIVSGDFYWLTEKDNKIVFAVGDCTGHGVPGAFLSILGITSLNETVNIQGITRSDAIVEQLRERVIHTLQQSRKETAPPDGIDLSLCVLDKRRKKIQFTGAMNDIVFIHDEKLEVIKGDHLSVSVVSENSSSFTMKEIDYEKGDVIYLFSDGYTDQFGGVHDKKYLCHRFYDSLLEIHKSPMKDQKGILEKRLYKWMNSNVQTDDITVMGIRL
jgi:ligand-binding sensor domain-containing protein/serine phosphatase RsbU (regulator of sigma subunit)